VRPAATSRSSPGVALRARGADTDNARIRVVDAATGAVSTLAGSGNRAALRDGSAAQAMFRTPAGLAWNGAASLYVADDTAVRVVRARKRCAPALLRSSVGGALSFACCGCAGVAA
jgi:hypothetical protein